MGAPQAKIDEVTRQGVFELLEDNAESWWAFQQCCTQWRMAPIAGGGSRPVGLEYSSVEVVIGHIRRGGKRLKRKLRDALFNDILDYQNGALKTFAEMK